MTWVGGDRIPPIPKNHGAPWTPELLKKVKRLFKEGHSYTEIAEEMGRSRQSIIYAVNYDMSKRAKRVRSRWSRWSRVEKQLLHTLARKGFTSKEISATFQYISLFDPHVKPRTIPSIRYYMGKYRIRTRRRSYAKTPKRHMKPWSPDEEEKLLRMYREGELISTIADELQRSKGSVKARLKIIRAKDEIDFKCMEVMRSGSKRDNPSG